jgi:hypothetical protein
MKHKLEFFLFNRLKTALKELDQTDNDVIIGLAKHPTSAAANDVIMGLALLYFGLANETLL